MDDSEQVTTKESKLGNALTCIENHLQEMCSLIDCIEKKLNPVLISGKPVESPEDKEKVEKTFLQLQVDDLNDLAWARVVALKVLYGRIEL